MKKGMLLLLLFSSVFVQAQSLKDALYGGKLKNDAGTVIRKGDDLSTKIDTARKAAPDSAKQKLAIASVDSSNKVIQTNPAVTATNNAVNSVAASDSAAEAVTAPVAAEAPKDNNAILKDYMACLTNTLKTEVLPMKKIKKDTYNIMVNYVINTDGTMTVGDVFVSPENSLLQSRIKDSFVDLPHLNPVLNSNGTARKANKRYSFVLTKD